MIRSALCFLIFTAFSSEATELERRFADELVALTKINSGSQNEVGLKSMAAIFQKKFEALGFSMKWNFDTRSLEGTRPAKNNKAIKRLFLLGHLDTVFDITDSFQDVSLLPESSKLANFMQPIYSGPGIVDDKGGVLLIEYWLKSLGAAADSYEWRIFLAADEEIGSRFSKTTMIEFAKGADLALVFEPGSWDFQKQSPSFTTHVGGNFGIDVQTPWTGENSSLAQSYGKSASDLLAAFVSALQPLRSASLFINVFSMVAGSPQQKRNVPPDSGTANISVRYQDMLDRKKLEEVLKTFQKLWGTNRFEYRLRDENGWTPLQVTPDWLANLLQRAGGKMGQPLTPMGTSQFRSGGYFLAQSGIAVLDGLGPVGGDYHSDQEWIAIGSVEKRLKLLTELLQELGS